MNAKLYQCPYDKAVTCNLQEACKFCEIFGEYLNNQYPILPKNSFNMNTEAIKQEQALQKEALKETSKFEFRYRESGTKARNWKWRFVSTANGKKICYAHGYNTEPLCLESIELINEGRWPVVKEELIDGKWKVVDRPKKKA